MATTVGSHSVSAFATPVNGGPLDANVVRGNDNTIRTAYVAHDADTGIHVQSSTLASRPSAGTAGRKWITADTGVYKLWYDDGTTWHEVAAGNIDVFVIADESLVKGDVVKITGYNNGTGAPRVAKVSSASDVAFGIVNSTTIANGATGYVTNTGLILDVDTQAFSIGNILYPNTSGGFTATKPTSGNYQACAYVLRSNQNNGVLYVEFSAPRIVERSDNTASTVVLRDASGNFSAGTITAGAVTSTGLVTFASLKGTGATTVTNILDEDNMASDSATALATQQSIKAYVDAQVATVDTLAEVLANGNTTGANDIIVTAGQKVTTDTIAETTSGAGVTIDSVLLKDDVVNATDIETGTISANDGTASATIANSTGVMTIASSVLTTTDINGGTIDGTTIGGSSAAAGTFTTVGATTGNITTVNATTVDTTSIEVTNVKAKDGTASMTIADSTGVATISAAPVLSALTASQAVFTDASKGLVSNAITGTGNVVMSASPTLTGTVTAATLNATTLGGTLSTAAQGNITSVGTLTSLTVSGAINGSTSLTISAATPFVRLAATTDGNNPYVQLEGYNRSMYIGTQDTGSDGVFAVSSSSSLASPIFTLNPATNAAVFAGAATISGNLAVDTDTLYVDAANNRVGIGTASPSSEFHVKGIGEIVRIETTGSTGNSYMLFTDPFGDKGYFGYGASGNEDFSLMNYENGKLLFGTNNSTYLTLDASGVLGLGVTPSAWSTTAGYVPMQIGAIGIYGRAAASNELYLTSNAYNSSTGYKYIYNAAATRYDQDTGAHIWYSAPSGTADTAITFTPRMKLDASGNLGIGATSPSSPLHIFSSTASRDVLIESTATSGEPSLSLLGKNSSGTVRSVSLKYDNSDVVRFGTASPIALRFETNDTERARITSGGYFKASNTGTYANATASYHELRNSSDGNVVEYVTHTSASTPFGIEIGYTAADPNGIGNQFLGCYGTTTLRAAIRSNGGLANYQSNNADLSDIRTKTDIASLGSMWDKVAALEIVSYKYIDQTHDDVNLGVIAQQVEAVEPVWVDSDGFGDTPEGEEPLKTVYTKDITFAAIKALQEAMARIEALEARLEALEA